MTKVIVLYKFDGAIILSDIFDTRLEAEESIEKYFIESSCVGTLNGYYEALVEFRQRLNNESDIIKKDKDATVLKINCLNQAEKILWKKYLTTLLSYQYIKMDEDNHVCICDM